MDTRNLVLAVVLSLAILLGFEMLAQLDSLLEKFVVQGRMKIDVKNYEPCWEFS